MGGTVGGPIRRTACSSSAAGSATSRRTAASTAARCRRRRCAPVTSARSSALNPAFRLYDPATGNPTTGAGPHRVSPAPSCRPAASARSRREVQEYYPLPNVAGTNNGTAEQLRSGPLPRSDARQLRRQGELEPHLRQPDLGQVLDDGRQRAWTCSTCPSTSRAAATPTSTCGASAPPTRLSPTLIWTRRSARNTMDHASRGPGLRHATSALDVFGIPGTNGAGVIGPGSAGEFAEFYSGFPQFNTGLEGGTAVTVSRQDRCSATLRLDAGRRGTSSTTRCRPTSPRWPASTRSAPASTS